jgi:hypothetical protein
MKKYIIELYARNVVNNEEIDAYISHINYRNDAILKWLQKVKKIHY